MEDIKEKIRQIAFERQHGEIIRNITEYISLVEQCKKDTYIKNRYYVGHIDEFTKIYNFNYKEDIVHLFFYKKQDDRYYYFYWGCGYK